MLNLLQTYLVTIGQCPGLKFALATVLEIPEALMPKHQIPLRYQKLHLHQSMQPSDVLDTLRDEGAL